MHDWEVHRASLKLRPDAGRDIIAISLLIEHSTDGR
jgi:hypothetical protein